MNGNAEHEGVLTSLMTKLKTTSEQIKAWSVTSRKLRAAMVRSVKRVNCLNIQQPQKFKESLRFLVEGQPQKNQQIVNSVRPHCTVQ